jgi:hypothetical protein
MNHYFISTSTKVIGRDCRILRRFAARLLIGACPTCQRRKPIPGVNVSEVASAESNRVPLVSRLFGGKKIPSLSTLRAGSSVMRLHSRKKIGGISETNGVLPFQPQGEVFIMEVSIKESMQKNPAGTPELDQVSRPDLK